MSKKRQAPANRHIYNLTIDFVKFTKGSNPTHTKDILTAQKWYANGNTISVVYHYDGFKMDRGQQFKKTNTGNYEYYDGMLPSVMESVKTWNKKTQPIKNESSYWERVAKAQNTTRQINTF